MTFKFRSSAGHGPGPSYNRGGLKFNEGDENLNFTDLLNAELKKYKDVDVKEIRRSKSNYDYDLEDRANWGFGADLFYSSHSNAFYPSVRGVEIILSFQSIAYYNFAVEICATIARVLDTPNRGVKFKNYWTGAFIGRSQASSDMTNWYGELRGNKAKCAMLVEHFFHTNLQDSLNYLKNKKVLADEIAKVIAKHFNLTRETNHKVEASKTSTQRSAGLYRMAVNSLYIRKEPNGEIVGILRDKNIYTITEIRNGWGKLKSGAGWLAIMHMEKVGNTKVSAADSFKIGDYVSITGSKYATGESIPSWVKKQKHKVSQIKADRVLLGYPSGISSWVYKKDIRKV